MSIFRDYPVDIKKFLPEFLRKDAELKALLNAESKEHQRQEADLRNVFKQFFVESATWGLADWERNLGLTANPGDTYEQRRNRIYLKLQSRQTSTREFMRQLAARYFSDGAKVEAVEDNPNESFWIYGNGAELLYFDDLLEAIDTYIPAHLLFCLYIREKIENNDLRFIFNSGQRDAVGLYPPIVPDHNEYTQTFYLLSATSCKEQIGLYPPIAEDATGRQGITVAAVSSCLEVISLSPAIVPDRNLGGKKITNGIALSNLDTIQIYPPATPSVLVVESKFNASPAVAVKDATEINP